MRLFDQQASRTHAERLSQLFNHRNGGIARTPFDVTDIGSVDPRTIGIILLAPALFGSKPSHIVPEPLAYIHAGEPAAVSLINLQTISDIGLNSTCAFERQSRH